ncbi:MAG: hypothetical protein KDK37_16515, partial [Leptospiraceae bacterium]|nr:hypothetical protein [Leptospiraceae bacterium]
MNEAEFSPLQLGLLTNESSVSWVQLGGWNESDSVYAQMSWFRNKSNVGAALQLGIWNQAKKPYGQIGAFNFAENHRIIALGLLNRAEENRGLEVGLINRTVRQSGWNIGLANETDELRGHQIGLVNIAWKGTFPFTFLYNYDDGPEDKARTGIIDRAWTPLQLSLYMPGQLFSKTTEIRGLRINLIYSEAADLYGVDLGLLQTSQSVTGAQIGLFHLNHGSFRGIQIAGAGWSKNSFQGIQITPAFSVNESDFQGAQTSLVGIVYGSFDGIQLGPIVGAGQDFDGIQIGFVGLSFGTFSGGQLGLLGFTRGGRGLFLNGLWHQNDGDLVGLSIAGIALSEGDVHGFQLGILVNGARDVPVLQLGGLNLAHSVPLQIGLIANYRSDELKGPQVAGLGNMSDYSFFQLGGLWNFAGKRADVQITPGVNLSGEVPIVQVGLLGNAFLEGSTPFQASLLFNYGADVSLFQISGLANGTQQTRLQLSGLLSYAEYRADIQFAGLVNHSGQYSGIQISGLVSHSSMEASLQVSGLVSYAKTESAIQFAGLVNYTYGQTNLQISGISNLCMDGCDLQLSGLVNYASGSRSRTLLPSDSGPYLQMALLYNRSDRTPMQVAFINRSNQTNIVQLGAFNSTEESRLQVGFLNLVGSDNVNA